MSNLEVFATFCAGVFCCLLSIHIYLSFKELLRIHRETKDLKAQNKLLDEVEEMLHNETPDRHA